ncbi:hypothetical protein PaecuDRAFT_1023 [Paenibacillus curdlanolyticus YK9]|uniref:Butirosin biosynthesis protein H N-terminal domain-containing protein n=1 Tax=Paenibacillus curdlanolyticus YK9 TaxID=717606 RepID=E0I5V1_9BACL|nr:BtrH N-terminal domain-containing protein [Paenibacillus curdlanolyticus]EFM12343.1 hypothetical protein PaecuDRAFT_1023 [Paenibacillus curdlanolyticus YK9]
MSIVIPQMTVQPGSHCLFASIRTMLAAGYDVNLSEAEIYFRCDGMNVEYHPTTNPYWLGRSGDEMLRHMNWDGPARMQYSFEAGAWSDQGQFIADIKDELAAGRPVILFALSGFLTYHAIYRDNPSRPHVVVLYGIDEANDTVELIDSFLLEYSGEAHTYQGSASLSDVMKGLYGVGFLSGLKSSFSSEEHDFMSVLHERINRFLTAQSSPDGSSRHGLQAYYGFVEGLEKAAELDADSFTNVCKEAYYCLRIGSVMHQWSYFMELVQEFPDAFRLGPDAWLKRFEAEHLDWKKHLLNIYKFGLRSNRSGWPALLNQTRQLLDRQQSLLVQFVDDMIVQVKQ